MRRGASLEAIGRTVAHRYLPRAEQTAGQQETRNNDHEAEAVHSTFFSIPLTAREVVNASVLPERS